MKHTPTPYTMEVLGGDTNPYVMIRRGQFDIVSGRYSGLGIEQDKADGEFIVRACNCHDELLEACEEAIKELEYHNWQNTTAYNHIKQAIAKAKERS